MEMKKAMKGSGASVPAGLSDLWVPPGAWPAYAPIADWCKLSGMGRRVTYDRLGTGDLKAIKLGSRTLVDVQHGLVYLRSRPAAVIRAPKPRNTEAT
jgi:hypothetical protein